MFWSANYTGVRELNFLLKEENVTLTQILEADDILQECKADNKALIQFLTRSEILAELITLITEEPPKDVELTSQYRHSNIACEVLTSQLSTLSHRLCMDPVQMNRLCDFVSTDPPLNPLLASYFSRTIEMLLKRSPKQDCYLHHIVCLRALDFFKTRRDFLPNLLRHISTSAIADTFKYFIGLSDPFNKIIMEWLDEHQFVENLIQIVCCTYEPEEIQPAPVSIMRENQNDVEKGLNEQSEKVEANHKDNDRSTESDNSIQEEHSRRMRAIASSNASALLSDMVMAVAAPDNWPTSCTEATLTARLRSAPLVHALLQGMFTSAPSVRRHALVNGASLLRQLTHSEGGTSPEERRQVELTVAPHLPLLHQALLREVPAGAVRAVGAARVHVAALLARLALSDVQDVHTALLSLGTVGVLLDMFFAFPENNFLHAQVCALVHNIILNETYADPYFKQLSEEYDLPTRLMDTFEDNASKKVTPRAGYMGHLIAICRLLQSNWVFHDLEGDVGERWRRFLEQSLQPLVAQHETPLGGEYPSENMYETNPTRNAEVENFIDYTKTTSDGVMADICEMAERDKIFLKKVTELMHDVDWDDSPGDELGSEQDQQAMDELFSPWESSSGWGDGAEAAGEGAGDGTGPGEEEEDEGQGAGEAHGVEEGWAQFTDVCPPPVDPFAPAHSWPHEDPEVNELTQKMQSIDAKFGDVVELTNNLLSAMSCMAPQDIASIVNDHFTDDLGIPLIATAPKPAAPITDVDSTPLTSDVVNADTNITDAACIANETNNTNDGKCESVQFDDKVKTGRNGRGESAIGSVKADTNRVENTPSLCLPSNSGSQINTVHVKDSSNESNVCIADNDLNRSNDNDVCSNDTYTSVNDNDTGTSFTDTDTTTSDTGSDISTSVTGNDTSTSVTGKDTSTSDTGKDTSTSDTGNDTSTSDTGNDISASATYDDTSNQSTVDYSFES